MFRVGDRVRINDDAPLRCKGAVGFVVKLPEGDGYYRVKVDNHENYYGNTGWNFQLKDGALVAPKEMRLVFPSKPKWSL